MIIRRSLSYEAKGQVIRGRHGIVNMKFKLIKNHKLLPNPNVCLNSLALV